MLSFLLLLFQHLDDDRDSGSEEMQVSSNDLLLETSEIVSLIITSTFSALIVKLSNIGKSWGNRPKLSGKALICTQRYFFGGGRIFFFFESTTWICQENPKTPIHL